MSLLPSSSLKKGLTLLEILLALSMIIVLFGLLWGLLRLFSGHYMLAENKASRSQLVRSIAEMLEDDLASAIQDPIHPLTDLNKGDGRYIRRFGLLGTATSLQIDVVEPNYFTTSLGEYQDRTGQSKGNMPQVPELKTVYYEFISPSATESSISLPPSGVSDSLAVDGSELVGSLQLPSLSLDGEYPVDSVGRSSLVRKFGLSRRELDFETPGEAEDISVNTNLPGMADESSRFVGSLSAPPEWSQSQLHADAPGMVVPLEELFQESISTLTAAQLAMSTEKQTMWAPEVVDCRFRYFDGTAWLDHWNSIMQNGLPVAIEVQLRLLPLDDVDILRANPELQRLGNEKNFTLTSHEGIDLGSRWVGTLQPQEEYSSIQPLTLDGLIEQLGLSSLMDRRVVVWLPTTSLASHSTLERRKAALIADQSERATRRALQGSAEGSGNDRFTPRQARERTPRERQVQEQTPRERQAASRQTNERQTNEREEVTRSPRTRTPESSELSERQNRPERQVRDRQVTERQVPVERTVPAEQTIPLNKEIVPPPDSDFAIIDTQMGSFAPSFPDSSIVSEQGNRAAIVPAQTSRNAASGSPPTGEWIRKK